MARKFETKKRYEAWALEECEEALVVALYGDVRGNVQPGATWKTDFERNFFDYGSALLQVNVEDINQVRNRLRMLPALALQESNVSSYARSFERGLFAENRKLALEEYLKLSKTEKQRWLAHAQNQTAALPPPHRTWEEYKTWRVDSLPDELLQPEQDRRQQALAKAAANTPAPPPPPPAKDPTVIRQLRLARGLTDLALQQDIVQRIDPDMALDLAEAEADPELRKLLVRRSLPPQL